MASHHASLGYLSPPYASERRQTLQREQREEKKWALAKGGPSDPPSLKLGRAGARGLWARRLAALAMLVLSEMQKDGALRGKRARHRSAHPELEGGASTQNVQPYADPCVPGASVLYVQATRSSLLRSVRTWGTGQPLRHGSYTVRVPVPHVPRTTAYRVPRTAYRVPPQVKARLQRDSTRGRLSGALDGSAAVSKARPAWLAGTDHAADRPRLA